MSWYEPHPFPRFRDYAPSIAIPSVYWDVESAEQRTRAICEILGRVVSYADEMGIEVTRISELLAEIEAGHLDPMIEAAIAEWFDENEPEIMLDIQALGNAIDTINSTTIPGLRIDLEAEITALDNALSKKIQYVQVSNAITADASTIYLGDSLNEEYSLNGMCVRGNLAYMLISHDDAYCKVECWDLENNVLVFSKDVNVFGKGNTLCYDNTRGCFWVPGPAGVYQADLNFVNIDLVFSDIQVTRIAFDAVKKRLWCNVGVITDPVQTLYYLDEGATELELFGTFPTFEQLEQDIAVYNDIFIAQNSNFGARIGVINYVNSSIEWIDYINFGRADTSDTWYFNEPESINFDTDGMLYIGFTNHLNNGHDNFICNIPFMGKAKAPILRQSFSSMEVKLNPTTQAKFGTAANEIKSMAQLEFHNCDNLRQVTINADVTDPYVARMAKDINVVVAADATLAGFILKGGMFGLGIQSAGSVTFTRNDISIAITNAMVLVFLNLAGGISYQSSALVSMGTFRPPVLLQAVSSPVVIDNVTVSDNYSYVIARQSGTY